MLRLLLMSKEAHAGGVTRQGQPPVPPFGTHIMGQKARDPCRGDQGAPAGDFWELPLPWQKTCMCLLSHDTVIEGSYQGSPW